MRAGLAEVAWEYPWSSASARVTGEGDELLTPGPLAEMISDWRRFLSDPDGPEQVAAFRRHEATGRPMGEESFIRRLEGLVGRVLTPQKPGRKPKSPDAKGS